jgi:hypothetical protein
VDIERASEAPLAESTPRCASRGYDDVEHRAQGLDATLSNNEHLIRTTDITANPRSYVGKHLSITGVHGQVTRKRAP